MEASHCENTPRLKPRPQTPNLLNGTSPQNMNVILFFGGHLWRQRIEEREHVLDEAVSCCQDPVLMNQSTTTRMEEGRFGAICRPDLTDI